jgi:hypothetical protein
MVDARGNVRVAQRLVGERCPALAKVHVLLAVIGQLVATTFECLHVKPGLGTQACGGHFASGSQEMGVKVARVSAGTRVVNCKVHGHLVAFGNLLGEGSRQRETLRWIQLSRQDYLVLARNSGVMTLLGVLGGIPQPLTIASPRSVFGLRRQEYFRMNDIAAIAVVVQVTTALIANTLTRPIGRCSRGATTCAA